MKKWIWLPILVSVWMTGCSTIPQSREAGSTAEIAVIGLQPEGTMLGIYAAAEGRADAAPSIYRGRGDTPAAAVEDLSDSGEQLVSCTHVEHLILSRNGVDRLEEVLSYAFQDIRQSTESQLWLVQGEDLSETFCGEQDPAKRLAVLKSAGKDGRGFRPLTLREAAAAAAAGEALLIPALRQGEDGLEFIGFGLCHKGRVAAWLTGEAALGASLLMGEPIRWTASAGQWALSLRSTGIQAEPVWEGDRITGLTLRCPIEGLRVGGWQEMPEDEAIIGRQTIQAMNAALRIMKNVGVDAVGLKNTVGMSSPLKWQALSGQWEKVFPHLTVTFSVPVTTVERH